MKNFFAFSVLCVSAIFTSCYHDSEVDLLDENKYVTFNLNLDGVEQSLMTRAIKEPGNLLVFDKLGDEVTVTTKTSVSNFGLPLDYGKHDIYFVAADCIWKSYSTSDLTVTWPSNHAGLSYVWAYHLSLEVDENTSVEDITLPLMIANVQVKTLDKVPEDVSSFAIDAPDLCKIIDLKTMSGLVSEDPVNYSLDVTKASGKATLNFNFFTFVPTSGYVGDIVLSAYDSNNIEVQSKTLPEVPVQSGYISLYSGYFFSDGVSFPLSYNDDWTGTNNYGY